MQPYILIQMFFRLTTTIQKHVFSLLTTTIQLTTTKQKHVISLMTNAPLNDTNSFFVTRCSTQLCDTNSMSVTTKDNTMLHLIANFDLQVKIESK